MASPDLTELAEDWLATKLAMTTASNPEGSDRARRGDLARWGRYIATIRGQDISHRDNAQLDVAGDLGLITLPDLTADNLVRALGSLRLSFADSTCRRMIATMTTFCDWLVRKGHLPSTPAKDDDFIMPKRNAGDLDAVMPFHAFTMFEIEAMLDAATAPPTSRRSAWPIRDAAMLSVLEGTGLRAAELIGMRVKNADLDLDPPMIRVRRGAKGSKTRDVPAPQRTVTAVRSYLTERTERAKNDERLAHVDDSPLWVRHNGKPMNTQMLDRLIRQCADQGDVSLPGQAAAHGFRHHYGMQLARRGVPVPLIQEAMGHSDSRTTAIYTRAVGTHLADAMHDAGWL